jgi:hypothetical protein
MYVELGLLQNMFCRATESNLYPPPDNIYLAHAQPGALVFNWTSNCSTLKYDITSDCGTCPPITNATTATCSDLQLTTDITLCNFRVSSVACDFVGNRSPPFVVMLKGSQYYYNNYIIEELQPLILCLIL